jgi:hypothetical protein
MDRIAASHGSPTRLTTRSAASLGSPANRGSRFATRAEVPTAIFERSSITARGRDATIGGVSPAEFERSYAAATFS